MSYRNNDIEPDTDHADDQYTQPSRRKIPGDNTAFRYDDMMTVDLHLLTGANGFKKQRRRDEHQEYFEAIVIDLRYNNPEYLKLLNDSWQWWVQPGQHKYPILFQIACDFFSIPRTSCEYERCFSTARRTITDDRNRLQPSPIEAVQLQKNWLRHWLVESSIQELEDLITRKQKKEEGELDALENSRGSPSLCQIALD